MHYIYIKFICFIVYFSDILKLKIYKQTTVFLWKEIAMSKNQTDSQLSRRLFYQREYSLYHLPYEKELRFYEAVKNGDIDELKRIMVPLDNSQLGKLSEHPVRNMQYHLVITIAFITRFCIEGGMDEETAYTLSDVNIQKMDLCTSTQELSGLHQEIVFDYAHRMKQIAQKEIFSLPVIQCIDYIYGHLHDPISVGDLAAYTKKNTTYLCGLFKNTTIGHYIRDKRIEAAENMLKYSDYSSVDISNYLAFNSHSHFISVFKKCTGLTPRKYRSLHFRSNWK